MLQDEEFLYEHLDKKESGVGGSLEELYYSAPPIVQQSIISPWRLTTITDNSRSRKNLAKLLVFAVFDNEYLRCRNVNGTNFAGVVVKPAIDPDVIAWVRAVVEQQPGTHSWSACVSAINKGISDMITKHRA